MFTETHELSFSDGSQTDVDPAVARDRSFMVFGSGRHAKRDIDLFITYRIKGSWGSQFTLATPSIVRNPTLSRA